MLISFPFSFSLPIRQTYQEHRRDSWNTPLTEKKKSIYESSNMMIQLFSLNASLFICMSASASVFFTFSQMSTVSVDSEIALYITVFRLSLAAVMYSFAQHTTLSLPQHQIPFLYLQQRRSVQLLGPSAFIKTEWCSPFSKVIDMWVSNDLQWRAAQTGQLKGISRANQYR